MAETDSTLDNRVDITGKEIRKSKPVVGRQIVCSLCGNGHSTLQKDGKGGYVHQQRPCPAKAKEE